MPQIYYPYPRNPGPGAEDISRSFVISRPIDWWVEIAQNGPLPVIVVFHPGGENAPQFLEASRMNAKGFWNQGLKAVMIAVQGVSAQDNGGMWNAGMLGKTLRLAQVQDEGFIVDAMERASTYLTTWYTNEFEGKEYQILDPGPVLTAPPITAALDKSKLQFAGYSQGAQMAYRMAVRLPSFTTAWTLKALAVFAGSSGGWYQHSNFLLGTAPNVDWTPATATLEFSVLHIHGENDDALPSSGAVAAPSTNDTDRVMLEVGWTATDARTKYLVEAYFTGEESADRYTALGNASGWGATNTSPSGLSSITSVLVPSIETLNEWDTTGGGTWDRAVYFYELPFPQGHSWAGNVLPDAFVEFFQRWGAL